MLELSGITKSYGTRRVLDDVGFTVADGRLTGFVGGNGAGKTTTMRIALGLLARDAGEVTIDGAPVTAADRRRFGYMPEERGLYPKMRVLEHIVYLARLHGFSAPGLQGVDKLVARLADPMLPEAEDGTARVGAQGGPAGTGDVDRRDEQPSPVLLDEGDRLTPKLLAVAAAERQALADRLSTMDELISSSQPRGLRQART